MVLWRGKLRICSTPLKQRGVSERSWHCQFSVLGYECIWSQPWVRGQVGAWEGNESVRWFPGLLAEVAFSCAPGLLKFKQAALPPTVWVSLWRICPLTLTRCSFFSTQACVQGVYHVLFLSSLPPVCGWMASTTWPSSYFHRDHFVNSDMLIFVLGSALSQIRACRSFKHWIECT